MGKPTIASDAKLFIAITFNDEKNLVPVLKSLVQHFGEIDCQSEMYAFDFTKYYEPEMGSRLKKQFFSFERLMRPENLNDIKLLTNDIEETYTIKGKRQLNLDPGYLTAAKVVLATTKNFSHRIYLGKGIYGDVHLQYINGEFQFANWTYADYKQPLTIDFFKQIRKIFTKSLSKTLSQTI